MVTHSAQPRGIRSLAPGVRILIVEAHFYEDLADEVLRGAPGAAEAAQASLNVLTVDGALENPATVAIALDAAAKAGKSDDAMAAPGCVI
jgi:6,7-dimethyl-8-ribityllumazine synthase